MQTIRSAFESNQALTEAFYAESDGYGEKGFVPDQGYDWLGFVTLPRSDRAYV